MPATPPRVVALRVSDLALRDLLRLEELTLAGASVERSGDAVTLVLYMERADAPAGATEMCPEYQKDTDVADPVRLTGISWYRNGFRMAPADQPPRLPGPAPDGLAKLREAAGRAG